MGVPGRPWGDGGTESGKEPAWETLQAMMGIAGSEGARFTVEPHQGSIAEDCESLAAMLAAVPDLRLTLDYAHFKGCGDAENRYFRFHARTLHWHIKPARHGAFKCPLDENTIDFPAIVEDLARIGWTGVLSTEWFGETGLDDSSVHPGPVNLELARRMQRPVSE